MIYIHRISDQRMGGISTRNFRMFRELCGDKTLKNVVILTNMWGEVRPELGEARERELSSDPLFFKPVLEKGARMMRHDASLQSAQEVVRFFLNRKAEVLQIQREIVVEKKDILQTRAGEELNKELLAQMEKHQREMQQLQEDLRGMYPIESTQTQALKPFPLIAAMEEKDEETRREIEYERQRLAKEMERLEKETQNLSSSFEREKLELEERMQRMSEEARMERARIQEEYQRKLDELEEMRKDDSHHSREMQAKLTAEIEALKRKGEGFFQLMGRALTSLFTGKF